MSGVGEVIRRTFIIRDLYLFTSPAIAGSGNVFDVFLQDDSFSQMADSYRLYRPLGLKLTMRTGVGFGATQTTVFHAIGWVPNGTTVPTSMLDLSEPYFGAGSGSAFHDSVAHVVIPGKAMVGVSPWLATQGDASDTFNDQCGVIVWLRNGISATQSYWFEAEFECEFRGRLDAGNISAEVLLQRIS